MVAPALSMYHQGSTPVSGQIVDADHKVQFLNINKGIPSDLLTIDIWNDKGGALGSDTAVAPILYPINNENIDVIYAGTASNGFASMIEARSCAGYGVAGDMQTTWTPIKPSTLTPLVMGNIPANCKRTVEIRINAPLDAPDLTLKNFILKVTA